MASKKSDRKVHREYGEILMIKSVDKEHHEEWDSKRNLAAFPRPFRAIACGAPNSGKTLFFTAQLIPWARPLFDKVYVCSVDPEAKEWVSICEDIIPLAEIPSFEFFDPDAEGHTLLILEDLNLTKLNHFEEDKIDRLFGHGSTHRNLSLVATAQDFIRLPNIVRRQANVFALWKPRDRRQLGAIADRVGIKREVLGDLFDTHIQKPTDYIVVDNTRDSPAPIRKNLFDRIVIE
jgi:hypothetical protein